VARWLCALAALLLGTAAASADDPGGDLDAVRHRGVLRHLGIPYAHFVTGSGDGFDVELMRRFAQHLGVSYQFVETGWPDVLGDLTGRRVSPQRPEPDSARPVPIRGDVIATGMTVLPWRSRSVAFSSPVFPTQVWMVARADSPLSPIQPSGRLHHDIAAVKALAAGRTVLGVPETCLDPALYRLDVTGARLLLRRLRLDEVAPALIQGEGDLALLDVADAMVALERYPGRMKVIGPVSVPQSMAVAFRRDAPRMREEFEAFLAEARRDGTYDALIASYFPEAPVYFREFFAKKAGQTEPGPERGRDEGSTRRRGEGEPGAADGPGERRIPPRPDREAGAAPATPP
jgi:ABC-type amino acid transport substrate-binding protein